MSNASHGSGKARPHGLTRVWTTVLRHDIAVSRGAACHARGQVPAYATIEATHD